MLKTESKSKICDWDTLNASLAGTLVLIHTNYFKDISDKYIDSTEQSIREMCTFYKTIKLVSHVQCSRSKITSFNQMLRQRQRKPRKKTHYNGISCSEWNRRQRKRCVSAPAMSSLCFKLILNWALPFCLFMPWWPTS